MVDKLSLIQGNLKAPKGQMNNFGKYKYRSAEDILESVKPLLTKHGLILTLSDEMVMVGDRVYVKKAPVKTAVKTAVKDLYAKSLEHINNSKDKAPAVKLILEKYESEFTKDELKKLKALGSLAEVVA